MSRVAVPYKDQAAHAYNQHVETEKARAITLASEADARLAAKRTRVIVHSGGKEIFNGFAKKGVIFRAGYVEFVDHKTDKRVKIRGGATQVIIPSG